MKEIRQILSENLVSLRKRFKLTQVELSYQLNYSDKAISRWEKGEVMPDVETLVKIARLYDVPITYLLEEHKEKLNKNIRRNLIIYELLIIAIIFTVFTAIFVFIQQVKESVYYWPLFVAAVPASCAVIEIFNYKYFSNNAIYATASSVLNWSLITTIVCMINYSTSAKGPWIFFIIGVPIQIVIIILYFFRKTKK